MKTSTWIKSIGILCIVFGSLGIIENISSLFPPQWVLDKWPDRIKLMEILSYIGIFVNTIYIMAGVFYLQKKSFSMNLMYSALTISILYVIIPLFIVKPYDDIIFVLISPLIDLGLLFGVYRISKFYYESQDEIVKPFGKITLSPHLMKLLTILALLFLSIPVLMQGIWIYAFNSGATHSDSVNIFYSCFPDFMKEYTDYFSLFCSIIAIFLSIICLNSLISKSYETLHQIILSIGGILLLLILFQMM